MASLLLFYATLFVLGAGLHFVGSILAMVLLGDDADGYARWLAKIGLVAAYKPLLTVNSSNELTLKRRQYDEDFDREKVVFGGLRSKVTRYVRNPQNRLHRFLGVRFGFMDERTGLVFNPRDADAAGRGKAHENGGSLRYAGEESGGRIPQYIRGVLGLEKGARGVNLQDTHYLVGGSSNAQLVDWLIEIYKRSQEPRTKNLTVWQKLTPIAALLGVLLAGAFIAGNGTSGGGGGGGGGATIPVGGLLLGLASTRGPDISRKQVVTAAFAVLGLLVAGLLFVVFPPSIAIQSILSLLLGIVFLPGITYFLGRSLGGLGLGLAQLYFILACFGFNEPVIHLREDDTYTLAEYSDLDSVSEPEWYRFAKTWVGVTYENTPDAWPGRNAVLDADSVKEYAADSPSGVEPMQAVAPAMQSAGHTGVVPKHPKKNEVYVQTAHAFSWFRDVGRGRLLLRALKESKEDHFGGKSDADGMVFKMTIAFALLGLGVDVLVFF